MNSTIRNGIDIDLQQKTREQLIMELMQLRQAVRESACDGCDPKIWSLMPEKEYPLHARAGRSWSSVMY